MDKESLKYKIFLTLSVLAIAVVFFMIVPQFYDNSRAEFTYTLLEDGTVTIDGYTGDPKKLEVPEALEIDIDGEKVVCEVVALSNSAFANKTELEKVILPDTLKSIGEYAFYNCTGLKRVEAPGVENIGFSAFYGCHYLKELTWSDDLKRIEDSAFASCTRLKSLSVPASCEYIGTDAFMACESLILDCSSNEKAAEVAAQYGIPTGFAESDDWVFLQAGLLTLATIGVLAAGMLWVKHRKKNKNNSKKI